MYENCSPPIDDGIVTKLHSEIELETVRNSNQVVQSEADKGVLRKRRKINTVIRPEEYEHTLGTGDIYSHEGSPGHNEDLALTPELGNSSMLSNALRKKNDSFNEQSANRRNMVNQHKDLDFSSTLKKKISKLKERGYDAPKKTGKKAISQSGKMRVEKEGRVIGDTSKEEKHQLSSQELSGRKVINSHKHVQKDAARKVILCLMFFICFFGFCSEKYV